MAEQNWDEIDLLWDEIDLSFDEEFLLEEVISEVVSSGGNVSIAYDSLPEPKKQKLIKLICKERNIFKMERLDIN